MKYERKEGKQELTKESMTGTCNPVMNFQIQ
jgi:hypothetical protein